MAVSGTTMSIKIGEKYYQMTDEGNPSIWSGWMKYVKTGEATYRLNKLVTSSLKVLQQPFSTFRDSGWKEMANRFNNGWQATVIPYAFLMADTGKDIYVSSKVSDVESKWHAVGRKVTEIVAVFGFAACFVGECFERTKAWTLGAALLAMRLNFVHDLFDGSHSVAMASKAKALHAQLQQQVDALENKDAIDPAMGKALHALHNAHRLWMLKTAKAATAVAAYVFGGAAVLTSYGVVSCGSAVAAKYLPVAVPTIALTSTVFAITASWYQNTRGVSIDIEHALCEAPTKKTV